MKILLIYPSYDREREFGKLKDLARNCIPLGLATIGAILRNEGHEVSAIDTSISFCADRELKEEVKKRKEEAELRKRDRHRTKKTQDKRREMWCVCVNMCVC